ncbi:MAG: D-aminoacylase [Veillonellaceae bacterium]|nr:D-aminoacylase [Veillonellaceae bacterium]
MEKILIQSAAIVDGSGKNSFVADVAIVGDFIAEIGRIPAASDCFSRVIDAQGLTLTPGFIDMHSHSDLLQMVKPEASAKIRQGITTELFGQDGLGLAPLPEGQVDLYRRQVSGLLGDPDLEWSWRTLPEYLACLERAGTATNLAVLLSHGPLRMAVAGMEERALTPAELQRMCELTATGLADGAFGLSTGLIYPPCIFADTAELAALTATVAKSAGIFVVHVRNERGLVKESIGEIFDIARKTGVNPHISHLKVIGRENWGTSGDILALFDAAMREGLDVSFDQYPYPAGSTMLSALVPSHAHAGGPEQLTDRLRNPEMRAQLAREMAEGLPGWENICTAAGWDAIYVTGIDGGPNKKWEERSLADIAVALGKTPQDVVFDLLLEENFQVSMVNFSMSEGDVANILRHGCGMLGTDGLLPGKPHPRAYASTARILAKYVRDENVLSLEEAVARMTGRPARRLGLTDRGRIGIGAKADLVLLDMTRIAEGNSFVDPCRHPQGIEYVFVNGVPAVDHGGETGALSGRVLRKGKR